MSDVNKIDKAREYIESLATGLNPLTGEELFETVFDEPEIIRCLFFVRDILQSYKAAPVKTKSDTFEIDKESDLSKYILPYEKITKNNLIAGQKGFLFTPAHYLNPIGMAVFRQTASDKNDFTSSVVYQNPGWKIEGDTGAQPVE